MARRKKDENVLTQFMKEVGRVMKDNLGWAVGGGIFGFLLGALPGAAIGAFILAYVADNRKK